MQESSNKKNIINTVKDLLSTQLGVDQSDIQMQDSLTVDLHMDPTALTDFLENLSSKGLNIDNIKFEDIETVEDVVEQICLDQDV
jgi:acyl carrier protein